MDYMKRDISDSAAYYLREVLQQSIVSAIMNMKVTQVGTVSKNTFGKYVYTFLLLFFVCHYYFSQSYRKGI
jgi:hypothetical protein